METIVLPVDPAAACAYREATPEERSKLDLLLNLRLRELLSESRPLSVIMDEIGTRAQEQHMSASSKMAQAFTVAFTFANAIAEGKYQAAHSILSISLKAANTVMQLAEDFNNMIAYTECPPENQPDVEVMSMLDSWPGKKDNDLGWVYVALSNDYYSEAVSVIVAKEQGQNVIRELEWGRP